MDIRWIRNECKTGIGASNDLFTQEVMAGVYALHTGIREYAKTPLYSLDQLSRHIGVGGIYIKDEANRMNLSSFKVLGGSYVVGRTILGAIHADSAESFDALHIRRTGLADLRFATATDGNHGRGIAWAAGRLGYSVTIFMPKDSSEARVDHIRALGAEVVVTDLNYDDTVRTAARYAKENGYKMVQDTVCEGCAEPPKWIMQGYLTIMHEVLEQLEGAMPTHIFLQAGVGAFAGAITGFLYNHCTPATMPVVTIVEAQNSDCFFQSAMNHRLTTVSGGLETIMAGLACGEPNQIAWDILKETADFFAVCPNEVAARGMRVLGNPCGGDARILSGESGAVTSGLLSLLKDETNTLRKALGLDRNSHVLLINTEGDTDPVMYRDIVWNGRFPLCTGE